MSDALDHLIIDDYQSRIFKVRQAVFVDSHILQLERSLIFNRCWLYAGHESEIPNAGDFRARRAAERPIILVRGDDGVVRGLINSCRHRGPLVCRVPAGTARTFVCPYHAWTYGNNGNLLGVKDHDAYASLDKTTMGLLEVPQLQSYRGFIFINFDKNAIGLVEYLADAKEYIDLICDQSDVGMEILPGSHIHSMKANWKLLAENSMDHYHLPVVHQRFFDYLREKGVPKPQVSGFARPLGNGHVAVESTPPTQSRPIAYWGPPFPESKRPEIEALQRQFEARFGAERARRITQTNRMLFIFPNLVMNDAFGPTVRVFFPVNPSYTEITAWVLGPKDEAASDRALRFENFTMFLGPGGYATPDDIEILESCQAGYSGEDGAYSDNSRGMGRERPRQDDELQMRTFWRRWHEVITEFGVRHPGTSRSTGTQ